MINLKETSLAVARTLLATHGEGARAVLAVADLESARAACHHLGLPESWLVERGAGSPPRLAQRLLEWTGERGSLVLSGSAQTIQSVRAELRKLEHKPAQKVKAYWAKGRTGLD